MREWALDLATTEADEATMNENGDVDAPSAAMPKKTPRSRPDQEVLTPPQPSTIDRAVSASDHDFSDVKDEQGDLLRRLMCSTCGQGCSTSTRGALYKWLAALCRPQDAAADGALILGDPPGIQVGEQVVVDPQAELDGDRDLSGFAHRCSHDIAQQPGTTRNGGPASLASDFADRAAKIHVDVVDPVLGYKEGDGFSHVFGVDAVELQAARRFRRVEVCEL